MALPLLPILGAVLPPLINMVRGAAKTRQDRLEKEDFLRLLVAQLRNQNPLNPLSNDQFVNQSTAFSSLESLRAIQDSLAASGAGNSLLTGASGLLGRQVIGLSATFSFLGRPVELAYALPADASQVLVEVTDAKGVVVKRLNLGGQSAGPHLVAFDGRGDGSSPLPVGSYRYRVLAAGPGGQLAPVSAITGLVTGVTLQNGIPVVSLGPIQVAVSDLTAIATPN
ncbi:MAG: flagellar hook capping protein [Candidatus Rokubacteria bacterium]|nr:flagellar hook capping protein [Candidatus Rokubacteria bacterium]